MAELQIPVYAEIRRRDRDFYARLEAAGFEHDWGDDESGLFMKYLRRGSGYYIDVGAAELVTDGRVKLAHGQVDRLTEDAVVLTDGTRLPADLVVYATGYGSMNGWAADLISQDVADRVGKVWGLGSDTAKDPGPWEGEQRNMWKPTRVPALWFHGGNLHQSRHYSLYLALQLKARAVGLQTPVYGLQEVHHPALRRAPVGRAVRAELDARSGQRASRHLIGPSPGKRSASAVAPVRSHTRPGMYGPRSITRTSIARLPYGR